VDRDERGYDQIRKWMVKDLLAQHNLHKTMHATKQKNIEESYLTKMKERPQDGYVFVYHKR
jgi:hypothetical protein